jgi:hypothetical protein
MPWRVFSEEGREPAVWCRTKMVTGCRRGSHPRELGPCSIFRPVNAGFSSVFVGISTTGDDAHPVKSATIAEEITTWRQYERIKAIMAGYGKR